MNSPRLPARGVAASPPVSALRPGSRCPRHGAGPGGDALRANVRWSEVVQEPFRLLFPIAMLSGLVGAALWPLSLMGWIEAYPGVWHVRIMVEGFFGGFMFGFLGTSLPKLLEVRPWECGETCLVAAFQLLSTAAHATGNTATGDLAFLGAFLVMVASVGRRIAQRKDLPPPGFLLVGLGWLAAFAGIGVDHLANRIDSDHSPALTLLSRLWLGHGFVLLGILGAGGFLLPRFLGLGIRERFESSPEPSPAWMRSAAWGVLAGMLVLGTYAIEVTGFARTMAAIRASLAAVYCFRVMPLERLRWSCLGVQPYLLLGLIAIPAGIAMAGFQSGYRVSWSHLELVAGFGLITLGVGTRVIFGHSGRRGRLETIQGRLVVAALLMLIGMASRMSGDFLPRLQKSHYLYGALTWMAGLILWAWVVLPSVLRPDSETDSHGRPSRPSA